MTDALRAVEDVARHSYGRVVARLAARTGDIAAAEDHVAAAFELALRTWPRDGIPRVPEAWLLTVARRKQADAWRRSAVAKAAHADLAIVADQSAMAQSGADNAGGDERLKLLFAIAHPAIDPSMHTALMLQTIMGLDAARIAGAYLVSPATMGQRLVRAKTKIRDAGIPFALPEEHHFAERLEPVMHAVYAAFGIGWELPGAAHDELSGLAEEAIWLGRVLVALLPDEPEPQGLLAFMLYSHSRRRARVDAAGRFVPLTDQDTQVWDTAAIGEAERLLNAASLKKRPGRFQLEAAVQSVLAMRVAGREIDWPAVAHLQCALQRHHPTLGGQVACAAAVGLAFGPAEGLAVLESADDDRLESYQPFWAVKADLLGRLEANSDAARSAFSRAIALSTSVSQRMYLIERQIALAP